MSPRDSHAGMLAPQGCGTPSDYVRNQGVVSKPESETDPRLWQTSDWQRLLQAAESLSGDVGQIPAGHWWSAFLLTLFDTGAETNDLLAVRQVDLDLASGTLECGPLSYRLHRLTLSALARLVGHADVDLFPWPFDPDQTAGGWLRIHVHRVLSRAGLAAPGTGRGVEIRLQNAARRVPGLFAHLSETAGGLVADFATDDESTADSDVDPTPEEIAAACAEIRASWSPQEMRARAAWANPGKRSTWTPPLLRGPKGD